MKSLLQQMKRLDSLERKNEQPPQVFASLLIPARQAAHALEETVEKARAAMSQIYSDQPDSYEIILIPNPRPGDTEDRSGEIADRLAAQYPKQVHSIHHHFPQGKGAAIRTGFLHSKGNFIFFTDADLPYDLDFIRQAQIHLEEGCDLVTGNRRLDLSFFDLPLELLPLAYQRHRLGLLFNWVVRLLFPIQTTDTQAGIKGMTRRLALDAFSQQICPGFFFDLELFLTALNSSFKIKELPVTLFLNTEKSTVRLIRDAVLAIFWLLRLAIRNRMGAYGK